PALVSSVEVYLATEQQWWRLASVGHIDCLPVVQWSSEGDSREVRVAGGSAGGGDEIVNPRAEREGVDAGRGHRTEHVGLNLPWIVAHAWPRDDDGAMRLRERQCHHTSTHQQSCERSDCQQREGEHCGRHVVV